MKELEEEESIWKRIEEETKVVLFRMTTNYGIERGNGRGDTCYQFLLCFLVGGKVIWKRIKMVSEKKWKKSYQYFVTIEIKSSVKLVIQFSKPK